MMSLTDPRLANVAHELRTPLTSLTLSLQVCLRRLESADGDAIAIERIQPKIEAAHRDVQRLRLLIEALLDPRRPADA